MSKAVLVALLMTASAATPALSCEPPRGYRIPTNVELVQDADVIVLARVVAGPPPHANIGPPWSDTPKIVLQPIEALKGRIGAAPLRLYGTTFENNGAAVRPAYTPLTEAHPSVGEGGCIREKYSVGTMVIAMFQYSHGQLRQLNFPFARQTEDVPSADATWTKAVRYYVRASNGRPEDNRKALATLKLKLAHDGDPQDQEIANDIQRYLSIGQRSHGHPMQMW